ncbi:hypothetical protein [Nocardioides marmoraquaticus]
MSETTTRTTGARGVRVPSYRVLLGAAVLGTTVMLLNLVAAIATDQPPDRPRTHQEQIVGVLGFGGLGLAIALAVAWWARSGTPHSLARRRTGAVVLGALAVPGVVFFFSALPAMLGVTAAHLAGLTPGRRRLDGLARTFGTVGLVIAVLDLVVIVVGVSLAWTVG